MWNPWGLPGPRKDGNRWIMPRMQIFLLATNGRGIEENVDKVPHIPSTEFRERESASQMRKAGAATPN